MKNIFSTDESVKEQITDSMSENLTNSDSESMYRFGRFHKKCNFLFIAFLALAKLSLNQRNISFIYGQRKQNFELKKVLLIGKKFL